MASRPQKYPTIPEHRGPLRGGAAECLEVDLKASELLMPSTSQDLVHQKEEDQELHKHQEDQGDQAVELMEEEVEHVLLEDLVSKLLVPVVESWVQHHG